mmetsp:Transcript_64946/g.107957  ORF Transcript_64946/g.107957 Transcript_64946/m.107957 type:complete len:476 (+) Transcript_64946:207-1634(+)|eukprot:CAMPEP_0119299272 /NCGR_PEP_ID=MMETSP1333-20130426/1369_1 /TAXON_ID=418940 /ORGANISM="Scyphosphaera apsteinii, Strain RCC1455" /LENGTH=475 /DNA_ID=CAMNT_0007300647 /DNA_START=207 /DNA_END=1634 /DNA_ORIENTATION=+
MVNRREGKKIDPIYIDAADIVLPKVALPTKLLKRTSVTAALALQNIFVRSGFIARTFECYNSRHFKEADYLAMMEECALREFSGRKTFSWETKRVSEVMRAAVFLRSDVPRAVYPNSLVNWDFQTSSYDSALCVGFIMSLPPLHMRGPAWPHDAHVSARSKWGRTCHVSVGNHHAPALEYASRRTKWFFNRAGGVCAEVVREFAWHNDPVTTCWSDWEGALRKQGAYWRRVGGSRLRQLHRSLGPFSRTAGCHLGTPWNQFMFNATHAHRGVKAIFYGNFTPFNSPPKGVLARMAWRSMLMASHIQRFLLHRAKVNLPIVQLNADSHISSEPVVLPLPGSGSLPPLPQAVTHTRQLKADSPKSRERVFMPLPESGQLPPHPRAVTRTRPYAHTPSVTPRATPYSQRIPLAMHPADETLQPPPASPSPLPLSSTLFHPLPPSPPSHALSRPLPPSPVPSRPLQPLFPRHASTAREV